MRRNKSAILRETVMDAFELLKNDHKKVAQLFKEIESASGQQKTQLFSRLKRELDVHAHIEEKVFYPALENTDEAREITLEAYEEHKVVKDLLAELAGGGAPNDEWNAKLTVLRENVEHHVEEEEGELFGKARRALSREQIERFGAEMEAEKARKQGSNPPPQATPQPAKSPAQEGLKAESPGVLQRIAKLVGLGDSSSGGTKKRKASGTKKSAGKKTTSKRKPSKQSTKSATTKRAGTTKKSTTKRSSQARGASKAGTSKTTRRQASSRARTSAKKTAPRSAGSKKGRGRAAAKRGRAK